MIVLAVLGLLSVAIYPGETDGGSAQTRIIFILVIEVILFAFYIHHDIQEHKND
jgi:hypothetical protein